MRSVSAPKCQVGSARKRIADNASLNQSVFPTRILTPAYSEPWHAFSRSAADWPLLPSHRSKSTTP
jgi:hypothetical protein